MATESLRSLKAASGGNIVTVALVVDDSAFARRLIKGILDSSGQFSNVVTAANGKEALERLESIAPDVITLDVEMPIMNGLETLARIMEVRPTPVVMISSFTTEGAIISIEAMESGAVDVVAKPIARGLPQLQTISEELVSKVVAASKVHASKLRRLPNRKIVRAQRAVLHQPSTDCPIVAIASSTGGPRALRYLVPRLSTEWSACYIVVQHLPVGFSAAMARDLNKQSTLDVREAEDGDILKPGTVLIAPAGKHCAFKRGGRIVLTDDPPLWGVRPSADVTFSTAGAVFGKRVIGVILTGMGRDGAHGLSIIKENGGQTFAEHESSCVVYGMPRVAIETGAAQNVVPLDKMPQAIAAAVESLSRRNAA
jgi:two-component system chemotaxis response regulator CheB